MAEWLSERWLAYLPEELLLVPMTPGQRKSAERGDARLTTRGRIEAEVSVGTTGAIATATLKIRPFRAAGVAPHRGGHRPDPEAARRLLSGTVAPTWSRCSTKAGASLLPAGTG